LNPGPPALEASTLPLGYRGGAHMNCAFQSRLLRHACFWRDRVLTDCGKHDLLCANDSGEYPIHLHCVHNLRISIARIN